MAILVTNQSHFKPMSFEEILKPYQIMTEEYNKREAEISALDTKAETMRQYADNEIIDNLQALGLEVNEANINQWIKDNPNSFATKYMNYASSLDKAAENLATKGLRGTNRKTIYDLTNQYQTNVVPIENAVKLRAAEIAEQKEGMKDSTMRYSRNAAETSLEYYINNTAPTYDRLSGASLAAQVNSMVAGIAKQMRDNPRDWDPILGGQYWQTKMQQGYTEEEILLAAANDPNAPKELTNIVRNVIDSTRLFDWEGARDSEGNLTDYGRELESWAWKEASKGLWGAAGTTTYNIQNNKQWDNQNALDLHQKKAEIDLAKFEEQERLKAYYKELSESKGQASDIMNRAFIGVSGETNEMVERLQGLRVNSAGSITTTKLDGYIAQKGILQKTLDSLLIGLSEQDIENIKKKYNNEKDTEVSGSQYSGYSGVGYSYAKGQETTLSPLAASKYNEIKNVVDKMEELAEKEIQEQNYIKEVYNKYSHLGVGDASDPNNIKKVISLGVALEDSQEKQQDYIATINYKSDSERKTININYGSQLAGIYSTDNGVGISGLYLVQNGEEKDRLSGKDANEKMALDNANIGIYRDKNGIQVRLLTGEKGKSYSFKGVESISRAEQTINSVDKFLKDFSKAGLNAEMLYDENGPTVYNSYDVLNARPQYKPKRLEGTPYYYDITYDEGTGTWAKVIINPSTGLPLYTNTLNDEIAGGDYRDYVVGSLLEMQLTSMLPRE